MNKFYYLDYLFSLFIYLYIYLSICLFIFTWIHANRRTALVYYCRHTDVISIKKAFK